MPWEMGDKGKGKIAKEPHKKRKLVHSSDLPSMKFGTIVSHFAKVASPSPKLMESIVKVVKVEMVRQVNEEVASEEAEASEPTEKVQKERTSRKSWRFLAGQDDNDGDATTRSSHCNCQLL